MRRTLITVADDFGLSVEINEAIEDAARHGMLRCASLMVAAPAAADAIRRARRTPELAVGLHLVAVEGPATLPAEALAGLTTADGHFPGNQLALALAYAFRPRATRALGQEVAAQFRAFAATGLPLDHANAHKHMHLHPVVGHFLLQHGATHGLRAVRLPREAEPRTLPDRLLNLWCEVLRSQIRARGMICNDQVVGLAATGQMDLPTTEAMLTRLPPGITEMYFHPATAQNSDLARLMPNYRHTAEYKALIHARPPADVRLCSYGTLAGT